LFVLAPFYFVRAGLDYEDDEELSCGSRSDAVLKAIPVGSHYMDVMKKLTDLGVPFVVWQGGELAVGPIIPGLDTVEISATSKAQVSGIVISREEKLFFEFDRSGAGTYARCEVVLTGP